MLRIIDANSNRIGEGLRFLEDVARFNINDVTLSNGLRTIRHDLVEKLGRFGIDLLSVRNTEEDVGIEAKSTTNQSDLPSLITANAKRVEQALRVIEELSKLQEIGDRIDSNDFKMARFEIYRLEQDLLSKIARKVKTSRLAGLYVILDADSLANKDESAATKAIIRGGAQIIQLRDKRHKRGEILALATKLREICRQNNVLFIVNDYIDIAVAADADGVHIGQEDLPLPIARRQLPLGNIIGCSTKTVKQALEAEAGGADYVAVGSIFPSPTKQDAQVVGIKQLREIKQAISVPVVAIGGINEANIVEVMIAGADMAAVISAVLNQEDMERATKQLVTKIEQKA